MKNIKNQKGAISLFVLLAMTFFLVFVLGAFSMASKRVQLQATTQTELQGIYKKDAEEIINTKYASKDEVIPVYNADHFRLIGSNEYVEINGKIYKFGSNSESSDNYSYILKGNILVSSSEYSTLNAKFSNGYYKIDKAEYTLKSI